MKTNRLGTLQDLPAEYLRRLANHHLLPLWPSLREAVPRGRPINAAVPVLWRYADIRPSLLEAGQLTPIEQAERRVLVLCNPGFKEQSLRATASIYVGMQLILPGETAACHRHTPAAVRFVIEGRGGYTVVNGEKLPMEKGDLILTPSWQWHEHGHEGTGPVIWLDALDLPVILDLEASYAMEGSNQRITDESNTSAAMFRQGGVVPYAAVTRPRMAYPLMRFPWQEVKATLDSMARASASSAYAHVAYINPETGQECLPTLGFSALRVERERSARLGRRSASAVFHVVAGRGDVIVNSQQFAVNEGDTVAAPTHANIRLEASSDQPFYVFQIDDAPLQRRIGIYQELHDEDAS